MKRLKKLLALEAKFQLDDSLADEFLSAGESIVLAPNEVLVETGKYNPDIFIIEDGLIRGAYLDQNMDKTVGFALPGTILISFHCYYGRQPSYYRFEALTPTTVIRIKKTAFDSMLAKYHDFALWVLSAHQNQLYYNEARNSILAGDARTRLKQLTKRLTGLKVMDPNAPVRLLGKASEREVLAEVNDRWKKIYNLIPAKILASYLGITEVHLSRIKRDLINESVGSNKHP